MLAPKAKKTPNSPNVFIFEYENATIGPALENAINALLQDPNPAELVRCEPHSRDTWKLTSATRAIHRFSPALADFAIRLGTIALLSYWKAVIRTSQTFLGLRLQPLQTYSSALILPPSFPGSLGDETMMKVSIEQMAKAGIQKRSYLYTTSKHEWDFLDPSLKSVAVSLLFPWKKAFNPLSIFKLVKAISEHDYFFCVGADVMDGNYAEIGSRLRIALLNVAASYKKHTTLLGFSFNAHPVCSVVSDLQKLPDSVRLCARDPVSSARLRFCLNKEVTMVADTAFLLPSRKPTTSNLVEWIERERKDGRLIVGINPSIHSAIGDEKGAHHIVDMYINTMNDCEKSGQKMSFLLIPHDIRAIDINSDRTMATSILGKISSDMMGHVEITPVSYSQSELQYVCGMLDFTITGRMHLAIKCLNTGVPIFCIGYQDKFEGLLRMFGIERSMIAAERALEVSSLAPIVLPEINAREIAKESIKRALPNVQSLAQKNYDFDTHIKDR